MKILFVDAGNYCRSPAAEVVARATAASRGARGWTFASAGLKDKHVGGPADPRSVAACAARGYDLRAFLCRQITAEDYGNHDLILAMDRANLAELEARRPRDNRTSIQLFLGDQEVLDPYYGDADGFAVMLDQIEAGVARLLARLP